MASHTLLTCNFCSDFASHCEVCRICPRHSAYCSCTNQINNHISGLSFSNIGVERTLDNLNYNSDNLYESLFLNCHYHDIVSINLGSVVKWLKHWTGDQHGLGSKPTCAILLCSWERHFTALSPAWWS